MGEIYLLGRNVRKLLKQLTILSVYFKEQYFMYQYKFFEIYNKKTFCEIIKMSFWSLP